jgi:hypothetical protein
MTLSKEDWEALKSNDGYIIYLDGEATPVGIGFDFNFLGNGDYTIDDLALDGCDGQPVEAIDYEAEAADHKADELAGR